MIKKILIAFLVLIVLLVCALAILAFMAPTGYKVERSVTINKPKGEVFAYIKNLKNQADWGPWYKKDPSMKIVTSGTDGTPGFITSWNSTNKDVGEGEQEIKKVTEGERLDSELRFKRPFESRSDAYMTTESAGDNQTKVKWGFTGSMPRPMNIMLLMIDMDKEVGKDFDDGLSNLKTILEKQ